MKSKSFKYLVIGIIILAVFLPLKVINDYRERDLISLINYKPADFLSMGFTSDMNEVQEGKGFEWFTKDKEPTDELMEFLSQYSVKKINEEKFNEIRESKERIEFDIYHSKTKPSIVRVYGKSVHILVGNYYEISNGPIDLEWIRKYNKKYNDLYEE
ncbi:hypothetical protein H7992_07290 [Sporosarcina sp. resist]|uniref:hypothetical protein n=1 Tax=Sporosarcina sp. resist TaxID=2762563 RepID=UPI00164D88FD|nr:hypothetical protein [Sporosarcina sp. resist]QNK89461.1 hypothetical protein H7992_07290 [Sporosarcina sp. resist]